MFRSITFSALSKATLCVCVCVCVCRTRERQREGKHVPKLSFGDPHHYFPSSDAYVQKRQDEYDSVSPKVPTVFC